MGLVFHYTSPEAALSILHQRALWFTDCAHMNDPEEVAYCYELYNRAWTDICRERGTLEENVNHEITGLAEPHECESVASEVVGAYVAARYYVFCTCTDGDSPAMWANYTGGGEGAGCVLAFDRDALIQSLQVVAAEASRYGLCAEVLCGPVLYDEREQLESINSTIKKYLEELDAASEFAGNDIDRIMNNEIVRGFHWEWLEGLAPFIKRPKYAGEREYRFVLKVAQAELPQKMIDPLQERVAVGGIASGGITGSLSRMRNPLSIKSRAGLTGEAIPYCDVQLEEAMGSALRSLKCRPHQSCC